MWKIAVVDAFRALRSDGAVVAPSHPRTESEPVMEEKPKSFWLASGVSVLVLDDTARTSRHPGHGPRRYSVSDYRGFSTAFRAGVQLAEG